MPQRNRPSTTGRQYFIADTSGESVKPEFPFWPRKWHRSYTHPAGSRHCETIFIGITPDGPRSKPAPPKLPDIPPLLQHLILPPTCGRPDTAADLRWTVGRVGIET